MENPTKKPISRQALDEARQRLITPEILGYADALAHHYVGCGLDLSDLQQEARYGVCQAALHYDAEAGATLKTFATYYIKKYLIKAIEEVGCTIRLKREERAIVQILSLDVELSGGGRTGADCLEDEAAATLAERVAEAAAEEGPSEEELQRQREEQAAHLLQLLSDKERRAVSLLFGLEGTTLTLRQTARVLQVQPERMRQIYNRALAKMELNH